MGAIKAERMHARTFEGRERAALEIFDYIECFYSGVRTRLALGHLNSEEFKQANWTEEDSRPMTA